jgi:hypothetical protein
MVHSESITEIDELRILISKGNTLKELPESNSIFVVSREQGIEVPIVSQMDRWMEEGIRIIYSLLPKTIIDADFSDIASIQDAYSGQSQIITFVRKERINTILSVLKCCLDFTEWVTQFDENKLSPKEKAKFYFVPLEAMVLYIRKELAGVLLGLENGRTTKTALLHLYGRIIQSVNGIAKLNDVICSHLLIASLRGLLELYVDMSLIKKGLIDNGVEKFFSFDEIYRFRSAKNLLRIDEEIKSPPKKYVNLTEHIQNEKQIIQKAQTLWDKKPKGIMHWSDLNLESRSRKAEELKIYRDIYYYGNMYVHSGYVNFPKTEDDAHFLCAHVYALSLDIIKESTYLICSETEITRKAEIEQEINGIYLFFGYYQIWKSLIQAQKR